MPGRSWPPSWAAAMCCAVGVVAPFGVAAQTPTFSDDFETGTLLLSEMPPGRWNSAFGGATAISMNATAAAAHRGARGMRRVDFGTGAETLAVAHGEPNRSGDYHVRVWMRASSLGGGSGYPLGVFSNVFDRRVR